MATVIETEKQTATYEVPASNLQWLKDQIEQLNRRARRLRVPEISISVSELPSRIDREARSFAARKIFFVADGDFLPAGAEYTGRVREWHSVTVSGERPVLAGWHFVATLQHIDADGELLEVIKAVPGEAVPTNFRGRGQICDHCKTSRRRNDTFIIRHEQSGEHKQVGRNCLADFLGHKDPHAVASLAELLGLLVSCCEQASEPNDEFWGDGTGGGLYSWSVEYYLAYVAACIKKSGWLSRTAAREEFAAMATADEAWLQIVNRAKIALKDRVEPSAEDKQTAEMAIEWAAGLHESKPADVERSDYLYSINVVARAGYVTYKTIGLAASIVAAYQREREELMRRATWRDICRSSKHFGQIKKREVFTLTLTGKHYLESAYGVTVLHRFVDVAGNLAVWFASSDTDTKAGETVQIKATVKDHSEYKGAAQTILTRCTILQKD